MDPAPLDGELEDRRGSHTQRSLLTSRETSWDTQGALETWRRALHLVSGRQNRVRPTRVVCAIQMAEKAHNKMLNIMNYSRNANENYNKVLPHSSQNGHHQHNLWMLERVWRKGNLLHWWWECKLVQSPWRTVWRLPKKLKTELPNEPAIPLLCICLEKTIIQKEGALQCSLHHYLQ